MSEKSALAELRLFIDVNELIRAVIGYHAHVAPTSMLADDGRAWHGDPAAVVLALIAEGAPVNGQRLVLCTSKQVLRLMRAKLLENYQWDLEAVNLVTRYVLDVVRGCDGALCGDDAATNPASYGSLADMEDRHRIAEAQHCSAELFITQDNEILDCWRQDSTLRPIAISAREFSARTHG